MSQYPDSVICGQCKLLPAINNECQECQKLVGEFVKCIKKDIRWDEFRKVSNKTYIIA